jgi:hypothetical protein
MPAATRIHALSRHSYVPVQHEGQATARDGGRYDCMDAGGRAAPGAAAESNAGSSCRDGRERPRSDRRASSLGSQLERKGQNYPSSTSFLYGERQVVGRQ